MLADDLWTVAERGADVLLETRDDDGVVGGDSMLDCYESPWVLVTAGRPREAERVLDAAAQRRPAAAGRRSTARRRWGFYRLKMGAGAGYSLLELELTSEFTPLCTDVSRWLSR